MPRRKHSYFGEVFCEGVLGRAKGVVGGFGLVAKDLPAGLRKKAGNGKGVRRLEKDWTKKHHREGGLVERVDERTDERPGPGSGSGERN